MKRAPYQYERRVLKCQLHSVLLALDVHCAVRTRQRADGSDMAAGSKRTVIRDMFLPRLLAPPPLLPPPREAVVWSIAMVVLSPRCDVTVEEEEEEAKVARGGPRPRCCAPAPHTRPVPIDSGSRPSAMRSFLHCRIRFKCFYRCAQAKIGSKVAMVLNVCRLGVGGWSPSSLSPEVDRLPRSRARAPPRPWGEKDVQPGSAGAAAPAAAAGRRVKQEPFQFDGSLSRAQEKHSRSAASLVDVAKSKVMAARIERQTSHRNEDSKVTERGQEAQIGMTF